MAHFNTKKADEFMESDLPRLWVSERENREFPNSSDYINTISLYYPLTGLDGMTRRGLVCFNIQSSVLIEYMSGFLHSDNPTFLVFDKENILLSSDSDADYSGIFTHINHSPDGLMTLDEIKNLLSANKIDGVKETFLDVVNLIRTNGFSYSYTHQILLQIISQIAKKL